MKKFALLGYNIDYSLSPKIHAAAFAFLGVSAEYTLISVSPRELESALPRLYGLDGFNVTQPHKTAVAPYLGGRACTGPVNTVVNNSGKLIGYGTDGLGFTASLGKELNGIPPKKALVLGAGGTAQIIAAELKKTGCEVFIENRTKQRAEELAANTGVKAGLPSGYTDLVVNCTSAKSGGFVLPAIETGARTLFFDTNYIATPFKDFAKCGGFRFAGGTDMLIYQAIAAEEIFLGIRFSDKQKTNLYKVMRSAVK
jgi:shikimate dehydrogenase